MRIFINIGLLILFLLIVASVIAFWQGGAPFKWFGEVTVSAGESIIGFGEEVDVFFGR